MAGKLFLRLISSHNNDTMGHTGMSKNFEQSREEKRCWPSTRQLSAAKSEALKDVIQRQIDATDREIDRLVYELHGLSEEEVKIVEGGFK
jgi:hypothetical protein